MAAYEGIGLACGKFPSVDVGRKIFGGENTIQQQMLVEAAPVRKCDLHLIDEAEYFCPVEKDRPSAGVPDPGVQWNLR